MDDLSDSYKGELESVISSDSLHLVTDDFRFRCVSTPDMSNIELSKRVALLELENERLRMNLENAHIELNARIAANQGLKGKISELYVEIQSILQDKQKIQNTLTDTSSRLSITETSMKWYQSQVHSLQASKKGLELEIDTYQGILKQRQQTISHINSRYKQLNADYIALIHKYQKEKQEFQKEIKDLQALNALFSFPDMITKLEMTEEELSDTKAELKAMEQRFLGNEIAKMSIDHVVSKQCDLISSMKETIEQCEAKKNGTLDKLRKAQLELEKLKSENENLHITLISSKQEQTQIQDGIFQLKSQLSKMIAQYKSLKLKNLEYEEKLNFLQDLINENTHLKSLSDETNNSFFKNPRQEKQQMRTLETALYGKWGKAISGMVRYK